MVPSVDVVRNLGVPVMSVGVLVVGDGLGVPVGSS